MPIRNQNWYDLQAGRRYPLDDRSTGVGDDKQFINDDILVDCHLRFPNTIGTVAFVQGITITPALVTVLFGVAENATGTAIQTIAAISLPLSQVSAGVNYTVTPLVDGVAGWIAFGPGIQEPFVGRYATPIQGLLAQRCARAYEPLPIPTLGKIDLTTSLQGLVRVLGIPPVEAKYEQVLVGEELVNAIVFRCMTEFNGQNPLEQFLSDCGKRPESGTCDKETIETINGVTPDNDGNITVEVEGFGSYLFKKRPGTGILETVCGGLDILSSIGLAEACSVGEPKSRKRACDTCYENCSSQRADDDAFWYDPTTQIPVPPPVIEISESLPDVGFLDSCALLPLCVDFFDGTGGNRFNTRTGLFVYEVTGTPDGCAGPPPDLAGPGDSEGFTERYTYAAANVVGRNVALFRNCMDAGQLGKTFTTELKISTSGLRRNGGIVLNYTQAMPHLSIPERYIIVAVDASVSKLRVLRVNGTATVVEQETNVQIVPGEWLRLSVTTQDSGDVAVLNVTLTGISRPELSASIAAAVDNYGDPVGLAGLYSDRSYTYFNRFEISE